MIYYNYYFCNNYFCTQLASFSDVLYSAGRTLNETEAVLKTSMAVLIKIKIKLNKIQKQNKEVIDQLSQEWLLQLMEPKITVEL